MTKRLVRAAKRGYLADSDGRTCFDVTLRGRTVRHIPSTTDLRAAGSADRYGRFSSFSLSHRASPPLAVSLPPPTTLTGPGRSAVVVGRRATLSAATWRQLSAATDGSVVHTSTCCSENSATTSTRIWCPWTNRQWTSLESSVNRSCVSYIIIIIVIITLGSVSVKLWLQVLHDYDTSPYLSCSDCGRMDGMAGLLGDRKTAMKTSLPFNQMQNTRKCV